MADLHYGALWQMELQDMERKKLNMKKLWYLSAFALIIIGLAGVISYGWKTTDKLPEFEKTWTYSAADLRKLHIVSDYNINVTFIKSTDGNNSISLKGQGTEKMIEKTKSTEISSQSLSLDLTQMPKKYFNFFDFSWTSANEELVISVTDDTLLDSLKLELDSGSIHVNDASIVAIKEADLSVDSGNLTLNNFASDRLNVDIDSGNFTGDTVSAMITASANSGNIKIENMTGPSNLSVDSGNIKIYKLDNADADLSADSGNVYVQVPSTFAGFYDLQVDSGNIHSPDSKRETKDYIKVRADSGNITIEQK
jgi:DUF4097 and DUF4098 domain-containing protein YvlB